MTSIIRSMFGLPFDLKAPLRWLIQYNNYDAGYWWGCDGAFRNCISSFTRWVWSCEISRQHSTHESPEMWLTSQSLFLSLSLSLTCTLCVLLVAVSFSILHTDTFNTANSCCNRRVRMELLRGLRFINPHLYQLPYLEPACISVITSGCWSRHITLRSNSFPGIKIVTKELHRLELFYS